MQKIIALLLLNSFVLFNAHAQFEIATNADGTTATITNYAGPPNVIIPTNIDGLTVTSIGDDAFPTVGITSVIIPDTVTNIGYQAFDGCSDLTNVVIPSSVINIGDSAFGASGLTSLRVPGTITNMGADVFGDCEDLTNVMFEFGVRSIESLFAGCGSLPSIVIPSSVTSIGTFAFSSCDALTAVLFEGNAPSVDSTAFRNIDIQIMPFLSISNYYTATAYYLPGTTGWEQFMTNTLMAATEDSPTNVFVPTVLWNPTIQATGTNFGVQGGQYGFDVTATTNLPIAIEACDDLSQSNWVVLQRLTLTNGLYHFSEPYQSNSPARFYRVGFP